MYDVLTAGLVVDRLQVSRIFCSVTMNVGRLMLCLPEFFFVVSEFAGLALFFHSASITYYTWYISPHIRVCFNSDHGDTPSDISASYEHAEPGNKHTVSHRDRHDFVM